MSRGDRKPIQPGPLGVIEATVAQMKFERLQRLRAPAPALAKVSAGERKAATTPRRAKRRAQKQARKQQRGR